MNYQTLLSAILENKYYTEKDISELCLTLQRNSGSKILSFKRHQIQSQQSLSQILLSCPQRSSQGCLFQYIFRKVDTNKNVDEYDLIKCNQNHSNECQASRNAIKNKKSHMIQNQLKPVSSNKSKNLSCQAVRFIESSQTVAGSPISKQSIMSLGKFKQGLKYQKQKKLYSQDQFSLLKKQLQLECKGLLSKSTEFQNEKDNSIIKKINFHCKYEQACPYEACLTLAQDDQDSLNKRYYSLQITNPNHLPQCILQEQIINYNENTMKIDKQLDKLTTIISNSSPQIKPKEILKKLANQLGQKQDFIYQGLEKKINKRAIKKYFDNCVAKIRTKLSPTQKINVSNSSSYIYSVIKQIKKDDDYVCRSVDRAQRSI